MIVADLDEFWFCKDGEKLPDALRAYDEFDVIYANWSMFGTSGNNEHPPNLRGHLRHRKLELGPNIFRKYAVRSAVPKRVFNLGIHSVKGAGSERTISDNEKFQINHYAFQSREFWETVKMTRGDVDRHHNDHRRQLAHLSDFDRECTEVDNLLADMVVAQR